MPLRQTIAELLVEIGMDSREAEKSADHLAKKLDKVKKSGEGAEESVDDLSKSLDRFAKVGDFAGKAADKLGLVLFGTAGIVGGLAKQVLSIGGRFEKLEAQLKTATGSAENAKRALDFIREFTAKTPFQLDQVTDAFVKLANFGIEPTSRTLTAFGDFASAMGKELDQFIEAVTDATTGEFERLKEFGIKTSQQGDIVRFTFRGVTTEVEKNAASIQEFLTSLAETNFGGAMAEQMETLGGLTSNLQDATMEFFNTVAQMGPLEEFKTLVADLRDAAGDKGGLAHALARMLTNAIRSVRRLLRGNLIPTLERLLSVLEFVLENFGKLTALFVAGKIIAGVSALTTAFTGLGLSIAALTGPIGIATAALVALGITAATVSGKIRSIPKIPTEKPGATEPIRLQQARERLKKQEALLHSGDVRPAMIVPEIAKTKEEIAFLAEKEKRRTKEREEREKNAPLLKAKKQEEKKLIQIRLGREILGIESEEPQGDDAVRLARLTEAIEKGQTAEEAVSAVVNLETEQYAKRTGRKKTKKKKKKVVSPVTVSEFFGAAARGELGQIADRTPSPREIEPTVAVDITNNHFNFTDTFQIHGVTDPKETGRQVVTQIKKEFDRRLASAGQQLATNLVR